MEHLINKISEIEAAASSVINGMDEKKSGFAEKIKNEREEFDKELEKETERQIQQLREEMKSKLQKTLEGQRSEAAQTISFLDNVYHTCHNELAASIFNQIIKE